MININKPDQPIYLSAREAALELSVSLPTLYAYVSRGMIRSEAVGDSRARRYRADDVRALRGRRALARPAAEPATPAVDTMIGTIADIGPIYRGVPAISLAEGGTLEQAATLLWDAKDNDPFASGNLPIVDERLAALMAASAGAPSLTRAVIALAAAADADPRAHNRTTEGRAAIGARAMRLASAAILPTAPSSAPIHLQAAKAWAPDDRRAPDLLRRALVLLADHELNASTWTVRCAASTGLTIYDALVAGMAALKGPRHGGAGPLAAIMVADLADGDLAARIRDRVALGERIPGFGHTVYKDGDPRADVLLKALVKAGADPRLAVEAPARITDAIGLYPNIDYALAVLMRTLGQPVGQEMALFAMARTAGWVAHAMEQLHSGALIRPTARYIGPEINIRTGGSMQT